MRKYGNTLTALALLLAQPLAHLVTDGRLELVGAARAEAAPSSAIQCKSTACAYRFLAQATFGGRPSDASDLLTTYKGNLSAWIAHQIATPAQLSYKTTAASFPDAVQGVQYYGPQYVDAQDIPETFWLGAITDAAQLRERVAYALSQIFVVSVVTSATNKWGDGMAAYGDILLNDAFGNFRTLLDDVAHNDAMASWLTYMYNVGPNTPVSGLDTIPDQNFAREVMQLFTIGLVELNQDGTPKLSGGKPISTYTQGDVAAISGILTGFAPVPAGTAANPLKYDFLQFRTPGTTPEFQPLVGFPDYHVSGPKKFLCGSPSGCKTTNSDSAGDLKSLLDALFNHPNTGPFIGKQLIQRLVTSNPSPAYVSRIAAVFANNGAGVRGDLKAVITAILLDPEARNDAAYSTEPTFGKIREPILRVAQMLRVLGAKPFTYNTAPYNFSTFELDPGDDGASGFGQTPFRSPTVFNFYYPNYTPALSPLVAYNPANPLVSPEMQLTTPATVDQVDSYLGGLLANGGSWDSHTVYKSLPVAPHWAFQFDYTNWLQLLATDATGASLVKELDQEFMSGQMSTDLQADLKAEVVANKRSGPQSQVAQAIRVMIASPEYLVQK